MHRRPALLTTLVLGALLASTLSAPVQAAPLGERAPRAESAKAIQRIAVDVRTPDNDKSGAIGAAVVRGNVNVNGRNITFSGTLNDVCPGDGFFAVVSIGFYYLDSSGIRRYYGLVGAHTAASSSCTAAPITIGGAQTSPGKITGVRVSLGEQRTASPYFGDEKLVRYRVR